MAMYFVQHGLAVAKEVNPDRPLSEEGRREVECVGAVLRRMGLTLRAVYHSGKLRARQTAEILSAEVGIDSASELAGMKPNDDVMKFAKELQEESMYVGHLPHMEKLVAYLVTGVEDAGVVSFSCGGVVCLTRAEEKYCIAWMVTPSTCSM